MKFEDLLGIVEKEPLFEPGLLLVGGAGPGSIQRQLARWVTAGRLHQLRRGLYCLAPPFQKIRPHPSSWPTAYEREAVPIPGSARKECVVAVTVRKVNGRAWGEALALSVYPDQKSFVSTCLSPVVMVLFKALFSRSTIPLAVYSDDQMVGLLLLTVKGRSSQFWLEHFFIDKNCQGRGYGKEALKAVIDIAAKSRPFEPIYLSVNAQNHHARNLYENVGFVDTGARVGRQLIYRLTLT